MAPEETAPVWMALDMTRVLSGALDFSPTGSHIKTFPDVQADDPLALSNDPLDKVENI